MKKPPKPGTPKHKRKKPPPEYKRGFDRSSPFANGRSPIGYPYEVTPEQIEQTGRETLRKWLDSNVTIS